MCEMCNAAVTYTEPVVKFEQAIPNDEILCFDREEKVEVNHLVWKGHAEGEKYAKYGARGTDHWCI